MNVCPNCQESQCTCPLTPSQKSILKAADDRKLMMRAAGLLEKVLQGRVHGDEWSRVASMIVELRKAATS